MAKEGTMVVLAFVAKQQGFFKASEVFSETGLERPLVYYHLGRFVERGYLEKQGTNYCVLDRDALIEAIAFGKKNGHSREIKNTPIFRNGKALRLACEQIIAARALNLPGSRESKDQLNNAIDTTIETLKNAKKWVNSGQQRYHKAAKTIDSKAYEQVLESLQVEVAEKLLQAAFRDLTAVDQS